MSQDIDYSRITQQHVLDAVKKIEDENIILEPSTKFDVVINGKNYPPKEIMRYANLLANGVKEWSLSGGEPTNKYLKSWGFQILIKDELSQLKHPVEYELTGNVWKLGCNWGTRNPSFYEMIKMRSIVIGVHDKVYRPGDLVVITEGHTIYALAKVIDEPITVTSEPDLEKDFEKYKIDYTNNVNYAKAEWYELDEDDVFIYQLQQGICRVNSHTVRNNAINLWKDRFINYWIFQGDPTEFDFDKAVHEDVLHDWTVTAHKDKIKTGDKVILWLTGKRAGCYALARITSPPEEKENSPDSHLWKNEPKVSLKAGIELTHALTGNPLLWQKIKDTKGLEEMKVGHRGTNFSATKKQYKILLNMVEKANQNMSAKIDLFINTILYGPPGTGKTYRLNEYKDEYFTDRGVTISPEDALRNKVPSFPLWKVLAAVINASKEPIGITELIQHPLVTAKLNPANKTDPYNQIWNSLHSYADDDSTQLENRLRRSIKLFHKEDKNKWTIADDKIAELSDIIGQEIIDIATNPLTVPVKDVISKTRFNFITFHQKYSYEDFIEGIKPVLKDDEFDDMSDGNLQFERKKGIFYNSCLEALKLAGYETFNECYSDSVINRNAKFEAAKNLPSKQFALFIDEINRANISAVFGELITLLEDDKRIGEENEMWIELPYSNEKFCVPPNLYVIGTMNTADRSIALLDIALRRRFEFKALYPEYQEGQWWAALLEALNTAIYSWKKNPDFFIGHAFFINKQPADLIRILNTKIIPLLYEYCQNNTDAVKKILSDAGVNTKPTGIKENFQIVAE